MSQESKTAVIYARYSSDKQNEQSIEGQLSVINAYAERNGYIIVDSYIDRALSGRSDDRPSFQKMIEDSRKKTFEYVIVYKLDRFSRDRYDSAVYKRKLRNNGVKVILATENITDAPEGVIMESVIEGYAEYYSKELSQKVKRGNKESRKKGFYTGGSVPYGYEIIGKRYCVNEEEAKIVREIFEKSLSGMKMKDIADDLNSRFIPYKKSGKWDLIKIKRLLSNEKYTGIAKFGAEVYENITPKIIDSEIFDEIRKLCAKRQHGNKKPNSLEFVLTWRACCAKCGSPLIGTSGKRNKSGGLHYYYMCKGRHSHRCEMPYFRKDELEEEVAAIVKDYISSKTLDELVNEMMRLYNADKSEDEIGILKSKVDEIDKRLMNCMEAVENGYYNPRMNEVTSKLDNERKAIEERIRKLTNQAKPSLSFDDVKRFISTAKGSLCEFSKESIIKYMVKSVYVDEDYIKVVIYPSDDPLVRSRGDNVVANGNRTFSAASNLSMLSQNIGQDVGLNRPPNVSRTL